MIRVIYYHNNGNRENTVDYPDAKSAFKAMVSKGKDALAYPRGAWMGAYRYDPRRDDHTLEAFKAKMRLVR